MTALLKILITIFFVAILLWLTFANREAVTLTWSPLHEPSAVPVSVLVLGATIGGFIWGGLIVWLNSAPLRRDRRRKAKDLDRLERELKAATAVTPQPHPSSSDPLLT